MCGREVTVPRRSPAGTRKYRTQPSWVKSGCRQNRLSWVAYDVFKNGVLRALLRPRVVIGNWDLRTGVRLTVREGCVQVAGKSQASRKPSAESRADAPGEPDARSETPEMAEAGADREEQGGSEVTPRHHTPSRRAVEPEPEGLWTLRLGFLPGPPLR